ncbi:gliding motility lipoprotein GldB [Xanthomarina spongicola]|uniref:Gliding motility-associated lipoprotein GldB n=1 Tax=Xanthomarina spongicola TaxID=570520 RepID=A0A316DWS5_9FLAO|nr:gliding motility lipoprotein GldB [Xanthomarina spongicola]PWK21043.1 gliding motility-associated lipoprotein GldB [Xanthomarina spongicola]
MKQIILLFLILFSIFSCQKDNSNENEIAKIEVDYIIERFDIAFGKVTATSLPDLKKAYPFMFSEKYPDSFWIAKVNDTLQQELTQETQDVFLDLKDEKKEIAQLFQHLKYYFPEFKTPRVITVTSEVDYRNKVIVTDTIVLISLDTYLGSDHKFYEGIQNYLRQDFNREQIVVDLAGAYGDKYIYQQQNKTLLDEMIYFGKQLYFKDVVIPFKTDAEKIGYSKSQLEWAKSNETEIWRFFIEEELLFSTDSKLPNRFINPAPFSKFYLEEIDKESPGQIGKYMGWQIVRAYMKRNDVSLKDLLQADPKEIFNHSNFKPNK